MIPAATQRSFSAGSRLNAENLELLSLFPCSSRSCISAGATLADQLPGPLSSMSWLLHGAVMCCKAIWLQGLGASMGIEGRTLLYGSGKSGFFPPIVTLAPFWIASSTCAATCTCSEAHGLACAPHDSACAPRTLSETVLCRWECTRCPSKSAKPLSVGTLPFSAFCAACTPHGFSNFRLRGSRTHPVNCRVTNERP